MTDLTDASIQIRISRKTLATLAIWFHENKDMPRSISELGRTSMEILKDFIVKQGFVPQVTSTLKATQTLNKLGLGKLSISSAGRSGTSKYLKQMQIDEGSFTPFDESEPLTIDEEIKEGIKILQDKDEEVRKALAGMPDNTIIEEESE